MAVLVIFYHTNYAKISWFLRITICSDAAEHPYYPQCQTQTHSWHVLLRSKAFEIGHFRLCTWKRILNTAIVVLNLIVCYTFLRLRVRMHMLRKTTCKSRCKLISNCCAVKMANLCGICIINELTALICRKPKNDATLTLRNNVQILVLF